MAGATNIIWCVFGILQYIFGTVGAMAYQAVTVSLASDMRFMAVKARGFHSVLGSINGIYMTACATDLLVMLARILGHFLALWIPVADFTGHNHLSSRTLHLFLNT